MFYADLSYFLPQIQGLSKIFIGFIIVIIGVPIISIALFWFYFRNTKMPEEETTKNVVKRAR